MAPHTEIKRGSAELMVLAAIEERARHGYEIAKRIDDRSGGRLRFHIASLYPMLYRMERRGWIEGKWIEKAGQRRRRYYRLTAAGRKVLAEQRSTWRELLAALQAAAGLEPGR
jgi:PadR family transcriptional regulator PadR